MGELLIIAEYLEKKNYAKDCLEYEQSKYISEYSDTYINNLEDSHGYSIVA